ncbi:MAG: site-2 protease family protein [bacterium]
MTKEELDKKTEIISHLVKDMFEINAVYLSNDKLVLSLSHLMNNRPLGIKIISERLKTAGYDFKLDENENGLLLHIDPKQKLRIPRLNIILFFTTLFTVYFVPVFLKNLATPGSFSDILDSTLNDLKSGDGIEFTIALISILLVHEMGHFITSRKCNIITSWPYFIPAPSFIGTFGAVIKSKSPFYNRQDLIAVGAAGPIAGWIVALFWLVYGLTHSVILPAELFSFKDMAFSMEGESILMRFMTWLLIGTAPDGFFFKLSEAAFAGWVGLLVTAINMLPIGQLDGGHILYGLLRKRQHILGLLAMGGLLILGFSAPTWWVFGALGLIFGIKHPQTLDDTISPSRTVKIMGIVSIIILILSFTPIPFR